MRSAMTTRAFMIALLLSAPAIGGELGAQTIQPPAWLAGCWEQRTGNRESLEMWMPPAGGLMLGASRTMVGGTVREYEQVMIKVEGGNLVYGVAVGSADGVVHIGQRHRHELYRRKPAARLPTADHLSPARCGFSDRADRGPGTGRRGNARN
jgi:hypothetical protein